MANGEEREDQRLDKELRERLRSVRSAAERRTIAGLARAVGKLPADVARAALEVSAGLAAGVSLRAGVEFLRAAPDAGRVLDAEELRAWGEMGRRLAMADAETGAAFFAAGVGELEEVPREARPPLFQVCARQLQLSTSVATETFRGAPELARAIQEAGLLRAVYEVALEIARRSAKHSADFLAATPAAFAALRARGGDDAAREADDAGAEGDDAAREAVRVAESFAARAGGIAADMWQARAGGGRGVERGAGGRAPRVTPKRFLIEGARRRSTRSRRAAKCCRLLPGRVRGVGAAPARGGGGEQRRDGGAGAHQPRVLQRARREDAGPTGAR